jgi:hypothetical protein
MAKKEYVKITLEGLNLLTILTYDNMAEMNGFYNKTVFFTDGFSGKTPYLFQSLGNIGAVVRDKDLDVDVSLIVISNKIMENAESDLYKKFASDMESRLNQDNSAYRRIKFVTEYHLICYIERRIKITKDEILSDLLNKYKLSRESDAKQLKTIK